ncbi:MAG: glycosyltransferase [Bacteroidetes bacterium]|nr:glycosyltransferase [Bacteroidota bacterium]
MTRHAQKDAELKTALKGVQRVCVQWPRFGPYHLARLRAFHRAFEPLGIELIGLETAAQSDLYEWRVESGQTSFRREQVFTDRRYESITPREMHDALVSRLDELQPDIVAIHTYSLPDSRACLAWCKKNRKASIVMTDSKADDAPRSTLKEWLKSELISSYDAAFLAGQPQQAYFEQLKYPKEAISLGYNAVDNAYFAEAYFADASRFKDANSLPGLGSEEPFMLASNRFLKRKNLSNLLSAYRIYRGITALPFRLIMLGDGVLKEELEKQVDQEGIEGVIFAGFRQIEELPVYYDRASFFVHPSRVDTWALVVNEAMAAGLPVLVCTGAGCHKDLVEPGVNGFTFGPDDIEGLAGQMKRLSEDEAFARQAGEASKIIVARWDLDRCAEGLLDAAAIAWRRKGRRMNVVSHFMIGMLRRSPSSTAFHSVES